MKGHTTTFYMTGEAFERYLQEDAMRVPLPYDALIVDLGLPGAISGRRNHSSARPTVLGKILPFIAVVSGASGSSLSSVLHAFPTLTIIHKPVSIAALLGVLEKKVRD